MPEPVLKWAGGKRQILHQVRACFPPKSEVGAYHEPFFGGGALFFKTGPHKPGSTINDINKRLMNFYRVVASNPDGLIRHLESFENPNEPPDEGRPFDDAKNYYYQQRDLFNTRKEGGEIDDIEEAALLMYLNRTCYNGLYRENADGEFNVPIGTHSNPDWVRSSSIFEASRALSDVEILSEDFEYVREYATENDLVYFDPPYEPVSRTSSFVEYSHQQFDSEDQERLRDLAVDLNREGVYVVISNSPPMKDLYQYLDEFMVHEVNARRAINSDADGRGEVGEIIVTNVPIDNRREKTTYLDEFVEAD